MTTASSFRASRAIGAMFFSLLGGAWLALWSVQEFGARPAILGVVAMGSLAIFTFSFRRFQKNKSALVEASSSPAGQRANRIFNFVNAAQWVLILVVGNVLNNLGYPEWIIASAIL